VGEGERGVGEGERAVPRQSKYLRGATSEAPRERERERELRGTRDAPDERGGDSPDVTRDW
jgi:hypothetical protein